MEDVAEKIINYLKQEKSFEKSNVSGVKMTAGKNKDGENLLYVRTTIFGKKLGNCYSNEAIYHAFNLKGKYVGCVRISVSNLVKPTMVEMEYWANPEYENLGNITLMAGEVIREVFDEKVFDGLIVRDNIPLSCIDNIYVSINADNRASLAIASKLGFDKKGNLSLDYYNELKGQKTLSR